MKYKCPSIHTEYSGSICNYLVKKLKRSDLLSKSRDFLVHRWPRIQWKQKYHIISQLFNILCVYINYE